MPPAALHFLFPSRRTHASDRAAGDNFGRSVSLSGSTGLVGASWDDDNGSNSGSAYVFSNLDTATGSVTQNVKLTASDSAADDNFGYSVSLDGDNFLIGAYGKNSSAGKAYTGSVSSVTTLDEGDATRTISGISFVSQDDWIIGQTTDNNTVTLTAGDAGNVTATGKKVFIGQNAGSDNNTLVLAGTLTANEVRIGAEDNTGNALVVNGLLTASNGVFVSSGGSISGGGTIDGDLTLAAGALFNFDAALTLTISGMVSLDASFGIASLVGLDSSVAVGTYTLIDGTSTDFSTLDLQNWGAENAYDLGSGKSAYFKQGSLEVEVVPEPSTCLLTGLGLAALLLWRRTRNA